MNDDEYDQVDELMDDFVYWDSIGGHVEEKARPHNRQNGVRLPISHWFILKKMIQTKNKLWRSSHSTPKIINSIIEQSYFQFNCFMLQKKPTLYCVFLAAQRSFRK